MRRMGRVRRMRIVARDHLEALILLLQDEFRRERLDRRSAGRRYGVCASDRNASGKGRCIHARRGNCAAQKNRQLARDAAEKQLLVVLHTNPLDSKNAGPQNYIPRPVLIAYYFPLAPRIDCRGSRQDASNTKSNAVCLCCETAYSILRIRA